MFNIFIFTTTIARRVGVWNIAFRYTDLNSLIDGALRTKTSRLHQRAIAEEMLRFPIQNKPRKLKGVITGCGSGPNERIQYLKRCVTDLFRDERIEGREDRIDEVRGYAEQLIIEAIQHGDTHKPTMETADAWLLQKDLVHKLFKVFAPRYEKYNTAFTSVYRLPARYPGTGTYRAVLELKGNPYPPVLPRQRETRYLLSNILLSAASKDFYKKKKKATSDYNELSEEKSPSESDVDKRDIHIEEDVTVNINKESAERTDKQLNT